MMKLEELKGLLTIKKQVTDHPWNLEFKKKKKKKSNDGLFSTSVRNYKKGQKKKQSKPSSLHQSAQPQRPQFSLMTKKKHKLSWNQKTKTQTHQ